jgi:hypothetical protein
VLGVPGVLVVGSEVPNLLQSNAAATLVVSQDVDLAIPISVIAEVKQRLDEITELVPSPEEPSVWVPRRGRETALIELNFLGIDPAIVDSADTYELPDARLPLMVFGPLSLLRPGPPIVIGDLLVPVPRPAGLALEKLVTDRSGEKGDRDLLVVAGLLVAMTRGDLDEMIAAFRDLPAELCHEIRSNLTVLSMIEPHAGMPDPRPHRERIATLLAEMVNR